MVHPFPLIIIYDDHSLLWGNGKFVLECRGVIQTLPDPAEGKSWEIKLAGGSNSPYVTDGVTKMWAMTLFQTKRTKSEFETNSVAPELDLDKVSEADSGSTKGNGVGPAPMTGLTPPQAAGNMA